LKGVLAYKADKRAKRTQTLWELAALDQEPGLEWPERQRWSPFWMPAPLSGSASKPPDASRLAGPFQARWSRLMTFLTALDQDVEIVIRKKPRSRAAARISVVAA
jgi:hypothetical protein